VSDDQEQPYIAMQYIPGKTLRQTAPEMTLEQKVTVIMQVAQALHSAHRQGLIHRDVKPDNIMVELTEQGRWKPYVLDFGLAREQTATEMTQTGVIMGTPHYMAPEQLKGVKESLDRRTDVYSLGATLYELLAGKPMYDASGLRVLMKILNEDPVLLRKHNAAIPLDIEIITMKCLEKEPQRRYKSARALANDLKRYLDGEPIVARKASMVYWLRRKARKHKVIVTAGCFALLLLLIISSLAIRSELRAREREKWAQQREELAQQLGHKIKEIEDLMRFAHLLPKHDLSLEKATIRTRMTEVADHAPHIGPPGEAPAHYALGRGHLTLNEFEPALNHLHQAWELGYQAPEVAFSLGQVLGQLYQLELQQLERIRDHEQRAFVHTELETNYLKPALDYMQLSSQDAVETIDYIQALIAYFNKNYDRALTSAEQAVEKSPWLYEAYKLQADILIAQAAEARLIGHRDEILNYFQQAAAVYQKAVEVGRSDETLYEGQAQLLLLLMMEHNQQGNAVEEYFQNGLTACAAALEVNPESRVAYLIQSTLYMRWGETIEELGQNPADSFMKTIASAQKVLERNQADADALTNIGMAYKTMAEYAMNAGNDPREILQKALQAFIQAREVKPNKAIIHNNIGLVHLSQAKFQLWLAQDPANSAQQAITAFQEGIALSPADPTPHYNTGQAYVYLAEFKQMQDKDPLADLQRGVTAVHKALKLRDKISQTFLIQGRLDLLEGRFLLKRGQSPQDSFERALTAFRKAIKLKQNLPEGYLALGNLYRWWATWDMFRKKSPQAAIEYGLAMLRKSIKLNSSAAESMAAQGALLLLHAINEEKHAPNRWTCLTQARQSLEKALELNPFLVREYQPALAQVNFMLQQKPSQRP